MWLEAWDRKWIDDSCKWSCDSGHVTEIWSRSWGWKLYLPLYKSYICGQRDHLSVAAISMPYDRKWNCYSLVGEWGGLEAQGQEGSRGEFFVGGSFWHITSLTSKFKYSLKYIQDCQDVKSHSDLNGNRWYFKHRILPVFHSLVPWHLKTIGSSIADYIAIQFW